MPLVAAIVFCLAPAAQAMVLNPTLNSTQFRLIGPDGSAVVTGRQTTEPDLRISLSVGFRTIFTDS
ncbi:MAG: hypothetical protein AAF968_18620, partial [Pseudomonadota bacterium]